MSAPLQCPTYVTCLLPHLPHGDIEGGLSLAEAGGDVDAVDVAVEPLAEHHPVEGAVKLDTHSEQILQPIRSEYCGQS